MIVIRAWREADSESNDVVARITQTVGAASQNWEESAAAGETEIVAAVRAWLKALDGRGDALVTLAGYDRAAWRTNGSGHGLGSACSPPGG